jgi:hypothetical protein
MYCVLCNKDYQHAHISALDASSKCIICSVKLNGGKHIEPLFCDTCSNNNTFVYAKFMPKIGWRKFCCVDCEYKYALEYFRKFKR